MWVSSTFAEALFCFFPPADRKAEAAAAAQQAGDPTEQGPRAATTVAARSRLPNTGEAPARPTPPTRGETLRVERMNETGPLRYRGAECVRTETPVSSTSSRNGFLTCKAVTELAAVFTL